jgi:hypothetical protein
LEKLNWPSKTKRATSFRDAARHVWKKRPIIVRRKTKRDNPDKMPSVGQPVCGDDGAVSQGQQDRLRTLTSHPINDLVSFSELKPMRSWLSKKIAINLQSFGKRLDSDYALRKDMQMPHAIIRGKNGRRHEVDFGDSPVRVEVYASEETVEIFVEADFETLPEERRRFAIINVPLQQFSQATGETARRAAKKRR